MNLYTHMRRISVNENWPELLDVLSPKYFHPTQKKTLVDKKILFIATEILTQTKNLPANINILLLKSIANSCVQGFKHKEHANDDTREPVKINWAHMPNWALLGPDPYVGEDAQHFDYGVTAEWSAAYIYIAVEKGVDRQDETCEILQYCMQFLVNFVTLACKVDDIPPSLRSSRFKAAIEKILTNNSSMRSHYLRLAEATCLYVHNIFTQISLPKGFYTESELWSLAKPLLIAYQERIDTADDTLWFLLKQPKWLANIYDSLLIEHKLCVLENILHNVNKNRNDARSINFAADATQFLSEKFKKTSDLILKTVDSYLAGMEPAEVTQLLDIISSISSTESDECRVLQSDKSLMINCIFLLKSLHMTGKTSDNHFTPLRKLSDMHTTNPSEEVLNDFQQHPAFGFKAQLIRTIGNLAHKHKINQNLIRETDAIPLLLDCCSFDARNPLILQWTILALRNLCENSPENQEIIRNCNKIGMVDNAVLQEMGCKLHEGEDGKSIRIVPLPKPNDNNLSKFSERR